MTESREASEQETRRVRRTNRRLRGLLIGVAVLLAAAIGGGIYAVVQRGQARDAADQARASATQARAAETAQLAQRLGAQALLEPDLGRSLLLARQAVAIEDSVQTRRNLLAALLRSPAAIELLRGEFASGSLEQAFGQVAVSPDGRVLAAAGSQLFLFDTQSLEQIGKPQQDLTQALSDVSGLAFSPDRGTLAVTSDGIFLRLLDARTLETRAEIILDGAPGGVAYSPDGELLATAETQLETDGSVGDSRLLIRDPATGEQIGPPIDTGPGALDFAFTPDGRSVLTSNEGGSAALVEWDIETRRPRRTFDGAGGTVAVSPDGQTVAIGRADGTVVMIDLHSQQARPASGRHSSVVTFASFSPDGKVLATASADRTVILLDVASATQRVTLRGHFASVRGAVFGPEGKTLYTVSDDGTAIAWDVTGDTGLGSPFVFTDDFNTAVPPSMISHSCGCPIGGSPIGGHQGWHPGRFSPDGKLIAAGLAGNGIGLWDASDPGSQVASFGPTDGEVIQLDFSLDGKTLAAITANRQITIWDVESRSLLHGSWVASWSGSGDSRECASARTG